MICATKEPCKTGDKIKLTRMEDDPCPVPIGTTGTVINVVKCSQGDYQIWVNWDNGRKLNMIWPHDRFVFMDKPS